MDAQFTKELQSWLDTDRDNRDVVAGATMLLQLNRNRILFDGIMRNPEKMHDKLEYELRKHLSIRLQGFTLRQVLEMSESLMPKTAKLIDEQNQQDNPTEEGEISTAQYHGRRDDHDKLPPEIQVLWEENAKIFFKIKELYFQLLSMENSPICDRFELLKMLRDTDERYRKNLEAYDHFELTQESPPAKPRKKKTKK